MLLGNLALLKIARLKQTLTLAFTFINPLAVTTFEWQKVIVIILTAHHSRPCPSLSEWHSARPLGVLHHKCSLNISHLTLHTRNTMRCKKILEYFAPPSPSLQQAWPMQGRQFSKVCSVPCAVYCMTCLLCRSIQYAACIVQSAVCSVKCAVCSYT